MNKMICVKNVRRMCEKYITKVTPRRPWPGDAAMETVLLEVANITKRFLLNMENKIPKGMTKSIDGKL